MNKDNSHPKLKAYFPAYTKVFNKHSYQKFLKNRPKCLQKLEIERYSSLESHKDYKAMGIHIKYLTQNTKSIQDLDFIKFPHQNIPIAVHKDMIKRFLGIKKLSQLCLQASSKSLYINYLYLKRLKSLRSLSLDGSGRPIAKEAQNLQKISSRFFRFLQAIKLEKLEYRLQDIGVSSHNIVNFPRYPSSIRSWSLSCGDSLEAFQGNPNIHQLLSLNHLLNLKIFQILTPLSLDLLNHVLGSINNELKVLAFKLTENEMAIQDLLPKTRMILARFQGLEDLAVNSESWIDVFPCCWRLKRLSLEVNTFHKENLKNLKEFLAQHQTSLEGLDLKLRFEEQPATFIEEMLDFLEEVAHLQKLQSLRIAFTSKGNEIHSIPILPLLTQVINGLKDLKELGICYVGADFSRDFAEFYQVLQHKFDTLEILELGFFGCLVGKRHLEVLRETLLQLKSLHTLKLGSVTVYDPGFFELFAETIHRCLRLRSLALSGYRFALRNYNPQDTVKMLGRIFQKSNLVHLNFQESNSGSTNYKLCDKFRLNEIEEQHGHIQTRIIPPYTYHFEPLNRWKGV